MAHDKVKIVFLKKMVLDAGHDERRVAFTYLRNHHADRKAALLTQRPCQMVWPVVEFSCSFSNQFLGAKRDRFCTGSAIDDQRDRSLGKAQVSGKRLQAHTLAGCVPVRSSLASLWSGHRGTGRR